jgi:hypothetical protein
MIKDTNPPVGVEVKVRRNANPLRQKAEKNHRKEGNPERRRKSDRLTPM